MATRPVLDDHGNPLPTFGFMNAHDAFRRDLPRFAAAAERLGRGDLPAEGRDALRHHWSAYRTFLEEHHTTEDTALFPMVAAREPSLKPLLDDLAAQHDELHELLPHISALLDRAAEHGAAAQLQPAFASLARLLEPHFAAEEEHLVPVVLAAVAEGTAGPPPRDEAPTEAPAVPQAYGVPFTVEHLDAELRPKVLQLFPGEELDLGQVEAWLADYRARLALWT